MVAGLERERRLCRSQGSKKSVTIPGLVLGRPLESLMKWGFGAVVNYRFLEKIKRKTVIFSKIYFKKPILELKKL